MRFLGLAGSLAFSLAAWFAAWEEVQPVVHLFKHITSVLP